MTVTIQCFSVFLVFTSKDSLERSLYDKLNWPRTHPVSPPKAEFSAVRTVVEYPDLTVRFHEESTSEITKWEWDSTGDGSMPCTYYRQTTRPSYTYPAVDGCYTVTLTVTGPGGVDTMTKPDYICVTGCPT